MRNLAIYKVNDKALTNGLPTIYVESIAIFNKDLKEVNLSDILQDAKRAQGYGVYVQVNGNVPGTAILPEGTIHIVGNDVFVESENYNYHLNPKLDFSAISDTKKIAEIEKTVVDTCHVTSCQTIAKGEWSVVFGQPNHAKTLVIVATVTQQISNGIIKGEDVFYFNLDDARPGYLEKLKILEPFGVIVLDSDPFAVMTNLINARQAKDKVLIIDTLICICDTNIRQDILDLSKICRSFCELGGTVITLAHANKHLDRKTGEPILEGVGLIRNNAHCVSYLQKFDDIIKMVNIKKRALVEPKVIFQIGKDLPYPDLFNSVRALTGQEAAKLLEDRERDQLTLDHPTIVQTIRDIILKGNDLRTTLACEVRDNTGESLKTIYRVLDGLEGKLWTMTKGLNNSKVYELV